MPAKKPKVNPKRTKNSDGRAAAATLSEQFHGRPARTEREIEENHEERLVLTDLGALRELVVLLRDGSRAVLGFGRGIARGVRLAASPDGGQLYLEGGDQALNLSALSLQRELPKDLLTIGEVEKITYRTAKGFHDFEPSDYEHAFGEEGGFMPLLHYDRLNRKLYLSGGSYQVRPEGITN